MKTFKIKIKGSNYLLDCDGEPHKMGFSATRYVRAADAAEAEQKVRHQISCERRLAQGAMNGKEDPPCIEIETIKRSWLLHLFKSPSNGLVFSPEDDR